MIDWNNYLYKRNGYSLIDTLRERKQRNMNNIPIQLFPQTNRYGISRIRYFGGFTPWTNIPINEKNGGNI